MKQMFNIEFVDYDRTFLSYSYSWLSDNEIKHLVDAGDMIEEDQLKWFESLKTRTDYYIQGIMCNDVPIGAVGIKNIHEDCGEYWGYIGEKEYWGKGIGKKMVNQMISDALTKFSLSSLSLKVMKDNTRAIGLYRSMGFVVCEEDNRFFCMYRRL